jgi:hypothetical protein
MAHRWRSAYYAQRFWHSAWVVVVVRFKAAYCLIVKLVKNKLNRQGFDILRHCFVIELFF